MATVTVEKWHGNLYKVTCGGRLKAKHMDKEKAEKFAKTLGWTKPHKKGSTELSKTAVKLAKKPIRKKK